MGPSALDDPPIIFRSLGHLDRLELAIHDLRRGREGKSKPWALRHRSEGRALPVMAEGTAGIKLVGEAERAAAAAKPEAFVPWTQGKG